MAYLVDVLKYPKDLGNLKEILESPTFVKVVWDGRQDYAELWHRHGIELNPVLDLQLVRIHENLYGGPIPRGFIILEGMAKVFSELCGGRNGGSGIDMNRLKQGIIPIPRANSGQCKRKSKRNTIEMRLNFGYAVHWLTTSSITPFLMSYNSECYIKGTPRLFQSIPTS